MQGGLTPLHVAVQHNQTQAVVVLLESGSHIDASSGSGATALYMAASAGLAQVAQILLERGAALGLPTRAGAAPLHIAANNGHLALVELIIGYLTSERRLGLSNLNVTDLTHIDSPTGSGATALQLATMGGHESIVRFLLEHGSEVNRADQAGATALHLAVQSGLLEIVRLLIDRGASPMARAVTGHTPLHLAAHLGDAKSAEMLTRMRDELGAVAVTARDADGDTPLHTAIAHGHLAFVRQLLMRSGPRVTAAAKSVVGLRTRAGVTMLHVAAEQGEVEAVELLLSEHGGADPDCRSDGGETPLHVAAYHGQAAVARLLLRRGADVDAVTVMGCSPLYVGVFMMAAFPRADKFANTVRLLLEAGAISTLPTGMGTAAVCTPLPLQLYPRCTCAPRARRARARTCTLANVCSYSRPCRLPPCSGQVHVGAYFGQQHALDLISAHGVGGDGSALEQNDTFRLQAAQGEERQANAEAAAARQVQPAVGLKDLMVDLKVDGGIGRALEAWRRHGVVVFVGLVPKEAIRGLAGRVASSRQRRQQQQQSQQPHQQQQQMLAPEEGDGTTTTGAATAQDEDRTDRSSSIRSPKRRGLGAVPVTDAADVLGAIASDLGPFLSEALRSPRQLLLDHNFLATAAGADDQEWHADVPAHDERLAAVQVALGDVGAGQGALQVLPGTHLLAKARGQPAAADAHGGARAVDVVVPEGTVTLYAPHLMHRGTANVRQTERVSLTFTLIGEHGLLPPGIPYTMRPEDSWRWWLDRGELRERPTLASSGNEPAHQERECTS